MATNDEQIEEASGIVNGLNRDFTTANPYQSGTLFVLGNGQLWPADDDATADEVNPALGTFRLRIAPADNDRVMVRYVEA